MNQAPSPIDFDALLEMLGGDKQIVASLLSKFVDELTTDLAASEQAITDQDAEVLRQIAHRIKGTSANLHALMLSAAARELEQACTEADFADGDQAAGGIGSGACIAGSDRKLAR